MDLNMNTSEIKKYPIGFTTLSDSKVLLPVNKRYFYKGYESGYQNYWHSRISALSKGGLVLLKAK